MIFTTVLNKKCTAPFSPIPCIRVSHASIVVPHHVPTSESVHSCESCEQSNAATYEAVACEVVACEVIITAYAALTHEVAAWKL